MKSSLPSERSGETGSIAPEVSAIEVSTSSRDVVRRAELAVRVTNIEKGERDLLAEVRRSGGYLDSETSSDLASERPILTLILKIPVREFDGVIARIERLGVRLEKRIYSQDVTAELMDLNQRLTTRRAYEANLRNRLRSTQRAEQTSTLMDQLRVVRDEIEAADAQRKSVATQAALSVLQVRLEQGLATTPMAKDQDWLAQTWAGAVGAAGAVARVVATAVIYSLLLSPFWGPVFWLARRGRRVAA